MFNAIKRFFRLNKEIFRRVILTLLVLIIYRFGSLITMPGVKLNVDINNQDNDFLSLLSMFGGGVLSRLSFFALGVSPFITASIVVQLLATGLIPKLSDWSKQGTKGQAKLNTLTKILTLPFGYLQAIAIVTTLQTIGSIDVKWSDSEHKVFYYFLCPLVLLSGTMIALLLADIISKKGIGQGTSVIIFTSILIATVYRFQSLGNFLSEETLKPFKESQNIFWINKSWMLFSSFVRTVIYFFALFLVFLSIIFFSNAERRLPIQQTGAGLNLSNTKKTYLPFKINPAGVIPVIFGLTFFSFFGSLAEIIRQSSPDSGYVKFIDNYGRLNSWTGIFIYGALVFMFTLMYSHIAINSEQMAMNFKKNGIYIVGIASGNKTRNYLIYMVNRLVFFGAFYLAFLSIFFMVFNKVVFFSQQQKFTNAYNAISGNSLLILIVIGENLINQIKDFRTQATYLETWTKKDDIFLW